MSCTILWFRRDLRLADNPALTAALAEGLPLLAVYIHSPEDAGRWAPGAASRWWLHHSLAALAAELARLGCPLLLREGPAAAVLPELIRTSGAAAVHWNRLYEPARVARDGALKETLRRAGVRAQSHNAALLFEPWAVATRSGGPYRVFTPFWKACLAAGVDRPLLPAPARLPAAAARAAPPLEALELLPRVRWDTGLAAHWRPGEAGAHAALEAFVEEALQGYPTARDTPARAGTSRLSPHLHFGEVGPRQVVRALLRAGDGSLGGAAEAFLRQLGWREFAHHLLFHFPHTPEQPLDGRFARFPWRRTDAELTAWQRGRTGIPIVDAGMRELWHTGWMHNRVRMLAASLLSKNLLLPWQAGAEWFWDTLVDADLANNTLGWQWVAGCGADAAPYFRIFNPVTQGERFDPTGEYVRRWLPELARVPDKYVHQPWRAPVPPRDYPPPIVDLKGSRERALGAWDAMRREAT